MANYNLTFFDLILLYVRNSFRIFMNCAIASRFALVASLSFLAISTSSAAALDYHLPHDPISPKSQEECRELYARHQQIWDQLRLEAKAEGDKAWSIARQPNRGSIERANPHYRRAEQFRNQAIDVMRQGSQARNRCMTQVRNHLRQEQRRQQDERTRIPIAISGDKSDSTFANTAEVLDGLPGYAGYQALRGVGLAGLQGFKRAGRRYAVGGVVYRLPTNSHAMSVAETLFRITEVGSVMLRSPLSDNPEFLTTGAAFGLEAIDRFARWNQLQQVLFRASVGLLLNIQSAASADLDTASAAFDRDFNLRNLERRMSTSSGIETARYQAAFKGVPAAPDDNLVAELGRWVEEVDDMRNIRAEPSTRRLAEEERRKRKAAAERRREQERMAEQRRRAEAERRWREEEEEWRREQEWMAEQRRRRPNAQYTIQDALNDIINRGNLEIHRRLEQQRTQGGYRPECRAPDVACGDPDDADCQQWMLLPPCE